jgi:pimeloyl-ACP methyl ester carboxylesterase
MSTLVLLPGLDGTGDNFAPLLPHLRSPYVVVRYPVDRPLGYEELFDLVVAALPTDGAFVVVGESFSGALALRVAALAPPGLVGVVLVATFHKSPVGFALSRTARFLHPRMFAMPMPAFLVRRLLAGPSASDALVERMQQSLAQVRPEVVARRVKAVLEVDETESARTIRVPVTYFDATEDALVRRALAGELAALIPQLRVVAFDSAHLILQCQSEKAAAAIEAFVAEHAS